MEPLSRRWSPEPLTFAGARCAREYQFLFWNPYLFALKLWLHFRRETGPRFRRLRQFLGDLGHTPRGRYFHRIGWAGARKLADPRPAKPERLVPRHPTIWSTAAKAQARA